MPDTRSRRNTPQRALILEELRAAKDHPTAADLYHRVRNRMPRISLGTVYRNLEVLHEDGLVHKLTSAGGEARFDGMMDDHDHVRCTECGHIADVHHDGPEGRPHTPAMLSGFKVSSFRLEYLGTCPDCQARTP